MKKLIYALPFVLATSFAQADELQAKVEQMMQEGKNKKSWF